MDDRIGDTLSHLTTLNSAHSHTPHSTLTDNAAAYGQNE